ncbi:MAG: DUF1559 domain-containing protein [Planctomycetota bacterium]
MSNRRSVSRFGFTLFELMVVIATIGILVSLALSANLQARKAAKRAPSRSNLKQITLAIHNDHGVHQTVPLNMTSTQGFDPSSRVKSGMQCTLPCIEQSASHKKINPRSSIASLRQVAAISSSLFSCPIDAHSDKREERADVPRTWVLRVTNDKASAIGECVADCTKRLLWFSNNTVSAMSAISLNDKPSVKTHKERARDWFPRDGFSSRHPGCGNFSMAADHLRFVIENMDLTVSRTLATIQEQEVV